MNHLPRLLAAIVLVSVVGALASGCRTYNPLVPPGATAERDFNADPARVWSAALATLDALPIETADANRGILLTGWFDPFDHAELFGGQPGQRPAGRDRVYQQIRLVIRDNDGGTRARAEVYRRDYVEQDWPDDSSESEMMFAVTSNVPTHHARFVLQRIAEQLDPDA